MVKHDISVKVIGKEHFFFQNFANGPMLLGANDFHPFFKALPFPEENEEVVTAYLVEGLDFFEPFLDRYELSGLGVDESTYSFAAEGVVIFDLFVDYFGVWNHLHIVVVVLALLFLNHVYELICSQLLLPHHLAKGCHLTVAYLYFIALLFWSRRNCR